MSVKDLRIRVGSVDSYFEIEEISVSTELSRVFDHPFADVLAEVDDSLRNQVFFRLVLAHHSDFRDFGLVSAIFLTVEVADSLEDFVVKDHLLHLESVLGWIHIVLLCLINLRASLYYQVVGTSCENVHFKD